MDTITSYNLSVPVGCNAIGNSGHTAAAETKCLLKSVIDTNYVGETTPLANDWALKGCNITQAAFQYAGYIRIGKTVGLIGYIIIGCLFGGATGLGAIAGGVIGAAIWGIGELVIWSFSYYGNEPASKVTRLLDIIIAGSIIGAQTGTTATAAFVGGFGGGAVLGAIELIGWLFSHCECPQASEGIKLLGNIIYGVFIGGIAGPAAAVLGGFAGVANWGLAIFGG
ncbi:PREDICTED: uncharacterized protein LOC109580947 [Amphimedon queenslandica]|uniref:Uncharacterized protein n=1 Tax=Amphimedon queenslandica TaxID=400682 RepID=A0A1X7V8U6_AMPQE|nr:PREDICTED: uncharacterized protein LOC109580947 [Amphimedon queenslandica]|eukprot:XP_019850129.1 PREDICTED: uncharacterized protein LOC109580947 [Amphimedon queenslandica]